ncbi:MAG: hypothetical protein ABIR10_06100 [Dokdonella sp.]
MPASLVTLTASLTSALGHAVGRAHPSQDGTCPAMQVAPACLGRITTASMRTTSPARFLYDSMFAHGFDD